MYENIIVIPYRNREVHLKYFIDNTVPLIEKYLPSTKVVVIEQEEGKEFNRGCVLNVGFKEYENNTKYFITQDVDTNPKELTLKNYYNKDISDNEVLGIYTSSCNTLGGIIKISNNNIFKINGFPNDYWGWGAEDKELKNRADAHNLKKITRIVNNDKTRDDMYFKIFNDVNDRRPCVQQQTHAPYKNKKDAITSSGGLNNINYTILVKKSLHPIVDCIKVSI
jgi:hypothetical protein